VIATFLLVAIFELLVNAKSINSVSLGGLSFSNTSLLQQFMPALIAYLFFYALSMVDIFTYRGSIYRRLVERFQPKLAESELLLTVQPRLYGPWGFGVGRQSDPSKIDSLNSAANLIVATFSIFILPFAFEFQAYYDLIHKYGFGNTYVWISVIVAAFFMAVFTVKIVFGVSSGRAG